MVPNNINYNHKKKQKCKKKYPFKLFAASFGLEFSSNIWHKGY